MPVPFPGKYGIESGTRYRRTKRGFGVTRRPGMATILAGSVQVLSNPSGNLSVAGKASLLMVAIACCGLLPLHPVRAQWWTPRAPSDFEECAERAEKAASAPEKTSEISQCNAKFAGRRKPGGGYTYFDFMQNRNFDIAGPNPTPEEQKQIDEQYTVYLAEQRQSTIVAAFAAKQQQLQQASLKNDAEKIRPATASKPQAAAGDAKPRLRAPACARHSFSCEWPRLSEGIQDLKKMLFGSASSKTKRGGRQT
jgi:hypothetical protein